mmetsp:Transcript_24151/g.27838  ORF Transcript_24151/g.27838 Transcript_24151/m.27838 type:complete len:451 (-) Transcript_24151:170-1522(-)
MARVPKRKTERAPPVDKLIKPAVGIVLAILGYYLIQGMGAEIPRVDVNDEVALREVFFGENEGNNYVILCQPDPLNPDVDPALASLPISSVFSEAYRDRKSLASAEFRLMDCNHVLASSGKSIAERFELNLKQRPTIFVGGKIPSQPKQIPSQHLKTGNMLLKALRNLLEPRAIKIESAKNLKAKCLNKPFCAILLKGGPPEPYVKTAMKSLVTEHPNVQFASIDTTVLLLTNVDDVVPDYIKGEHRFVLFRKISGGLNATAIAEDGSTVKEGRLITSVAPFKDDVKYSSLSNHITKSVSNPVSQFKKLAALPSLKTRTKKMDEAERKKRERKAEQKQREAEAATQQASGGGSGAFGSGTDMKDERRSERERRRAEHNAQNDVKPRTPEEEAAREAARRKRMHEESEKWNVMDEDSSPESETFDDDEGDDDEEELLNDEDEDEEEVMDLD